MNRSLPEFEEHVNRNIDKGDFDIAMQAIADLVSKVVEDSTSIARVFGSARLDMLCQRIGLEMAKRHSLVNPAHSGDDKNRVVFIATELYNTGGHTAVIEEIIKMQPEKEYFILLTDMFNRLNLSSIRNRFSEVFIEQAPANISLSAKVEWLQKRLVEIAPRRAFLFNHHQDVIAVAAAQPNLVGELVFYHHCDHQLCLGLFLPHARHVDSHNMGFFNCREVLGIRNVYWPLVTTDFGVRPDQAAFLADGNLRTCSSGAGRKFEQRYLYAYDEVIPALLEVTKGVHIHIGGLSDNYLQNIRRALELRGIDPGRFVLIPWVKSLWKAMIENRVDLYLTSFPLGGGLAGIEVMGSGTPIVVHHSYLSRFHGGADLIYPEAFCWSEPRQLYDYVQRLNSDTLITQSIYARKHYEQHYAPNNLKSVLDITNDSCSLMPSPLKAYSPESLQAYLDQMEHDQIAQQRDQIAQLTNECNRFIQEVAGHGAIVENLQATVQSLQHLLEDKTQENIKLDLKATVLEQQLSEIVSSRSWRFTSFFREVSRYLRGAINKLALRKIFISQMKSGFPSDEVIPLEPLKGNLELPSPNTLLNQGLLKIQGWVFSEGLRILALTVRVNGGMSIPLQMGMLRSDVAASFPNVEESDYAGFQGSISLSGFDNNQITLCIEGEFENGQKMVIFSRCVRNIEPLQKTVQTFSTKVLLRIRFIGMLVGKIVQAILHRRWPSSFYDLKRKVRALKSRYRFIESKQIRMGYRPDSAKSYECWLSQNEFTPVLINYLKAKADELVGCGPKISIVVPVYNTAFDFLKKMIESVRQQIYPCWELCIADDASTYPEIRPYLSMLSREDSRIKVVYRKKNGHIVEATQSALELCTGDYVAFLDHDDELSIDALLHVAECIYKTPMADWVYTDEDKIDSEGRRYDPQFKGDWSPEMAITHNYTHHLTVVRRSLIQKVGGFRKGFEGAQDLDLFLRIAEETHPDRILHVPYICYHWRAHDKSTASDGKQKEYIFEHARLAINEALNRRRLEAEAFLPKFAETHNLCLHQLRWDSGLIKESPVTIIIPTRDRVDLLKPCISSLERTVNAKHVRLIIMDDRSADPETLSYLEALPMNCSINTKVVKPKRGDGKFNFARLINEAVEYVETPAVLILNNDIEAMEPGWLEDMVGWLSIPGVGAVGARLFFPDGTVQHAGVAVGAHYGLADHFFIGQHQDELGYLFLARAARNVSAVTGACLLTRLESFKRLSGMDEEKFAVAYNDVDYCLRLWNNGERVVYTPQATLIHHTGASRGLGYDPAEHLNFIQRYDGYKDPFVNPAIDQNSMRMALNPNYVGYSSYAGRIKMLLLTHNLNFEGAPIVALELARYLSENEGFQVLTLSPIDGPLRKRYEEYNLPIEILKKPIGWGEGLTKMYARLQDLGNEISVQDFDLIGCNTLNTFWGIEWANRIQKPSIWYIHESTDLDRHFAYLPGEMASIALDCFPRATRIVIAAEATARMYYDFDVENHIRVIPGGLPLDRIDSYRSKNNKEALRRKYGLPQDRKIITIIGTTCERKGQHVFVSAAEYLLKNHPGISKEALFLIVGGRDGPYLENLRKQIKKVDEDIIQLLMETPDIYDFYLMSDVFVCASSEESFPMVVLLAMAFELPIVSTDVHGIPEIIEAEMDGLLVSPGRPRAMAKQILRILEDPKLGNRLARHAWHSVQRKFDNYKLMPQQARMCREAVISSKGLLS